jgi:hypothetical protein
MARRRAGTGGDADALEELALYDGSAYQSGPPIFSFIDYKYRGLSEDLADVTHEIEARVTLHERFQGELDYQISRDAWSLEQFAGWGLGYNSGVDAKRSLLERRLTQARREKRQVSLDTWRDLVELRKEQRRVRLELGEVARLKRMTEGVMVSGRGRFVPKTEADRGFGDRQFVVGVPAGSSSSSPY